MDTERSAVVNIGGEEHRLILTTKATKEIAARYGGLENLGAKLMKSENFEMAIGEIVWLITLLANQSILIHNFKDPDHRRELLTEEMVELLTTPVDLADYKAAITEAMYKGAQRNMVYPHEGHIHLIQVLDKGGLVAGANLLKIVIAFIPHEMVALQQFAGQAA